MPRSENQKLRDAIQKEINSLIRDHDGNRGHPSFSEANEAFSGRVQSLKDAISNLSPVTPSDDTNVFSPIQCKDVGERGLMYLCDRQNIRYYGHDRDHLVAQCCKRDPDQYIPALAIDWRLVRDHPPSSHPMDNILGTTSVSGRELLNYLNARTSESLTELIKDWVSEKLKTNPEEGEDVNKVRVRGDVTVTAIDRTETLHLQEYRGHITHSHHPDVQCNYKVTVWGPKYFRTNRTELGISGGCFIDKKQVL